MMRVCSACSATIERKDCHKNRYLEYICRKCRAEGVKFTRSGQRRYFLERERPGIFLGLAIACMVLLAISTSLLTFHPFSFFRGEAEVPLDRQAGVSLNAPINARLNESQVQTALPPKNEEP